MSTELRCKIVTARKQNQCSLCTGRIRPGERYERATLIHDGQIYDFLTCMPCVEDDVVGRTDRMFGYDDGVDDEIAYEWACEVEYDQEGRSAHEIKAAKRYLERRDKAAQPAGNPDTSEPVRNPSTFGGAA